MSAAITSTERKLQMIVAERLQMAPEQVKLDQSLLEDMGLDSFSILSIMLEIENAFPPITLSDKSFEELRSLKDVAHYIDQTLNKP